MLGSNKATEEKENDDFFSWSIICYSRLLVFHAIGSSTRNDEPRVDLRTDGLSSLSSVEASPNPPIKHNHKHAHQQNTISDLIDSHRIRRIHKDTKGSMEDPPL